MCRTKGLIMVLTLTIVFGLLSNFSSFSVQAGNVQLINGIGKHDFNFSEEGGMLISTGRFYLTNTYDFDVDASIRGNIYKELEKVDMTKLPEDTETNSSILVYDKVNHFKYISRIHPKITPTVYFYFLNSSWIEIPEQEVTIPANSTVEIIYKIKVPTKTVWESIEGNVSKGFLGYITISGGSTGGVGIRYNHKVFMVFEGEYQETDTFLSGLGFSIGIFLFISLISLGIIQGVDKFKKFRIKRKGNII